MKPKNTHPGTPEGVRVEPHNLTLTLKWPSGAEVKVLLGENPGLRGMVAEGSMLSTSSEVGFVLVALNGADGDTVFYSPAEGLGAEDTISQAVETLTACRDAIVGVKNL